MPKEMITESTTLLGILEHMSTKADEALEKLQIDTKAISSIRNRKIWVIPGSEAPQCVDVESGEEIDAMCAIKIELK